MNLFYTELKDEYCEEICVLITVYCMEWGNADIDKVISYARYISTSRLRKVERYRTHGDKVRLILAELLLRYALFKNNKVFREPLYDGYGKPYIKDIYFSISHSEKMVAVAYGQNDVGVDIEIKQTDIEHLDYIFSTSERDYIYNGPDNMKEERFIRMWTLKESYLKMLGIGFLKDPALYSIQIDGQVFRCKAKNSVDDIDLVSIDLENDYFMGICSRDSKVSLEYVTFRELETMYGRL